MGKSAKVHKRVRKPQPKPVAVQSAKKRAELKPKHGPVLGGADYVTLLLGGRRKAAEEASKLPMT